jgi:hypothetical protein
MLNKDDMTIFLGGGVECEIFSSDMSRLAIVNNKRKLLSMKPRIQVVHVTV